MHYWFDICRSRCRVRVRIPVAGKTFPVSQNVQTGFGAHLASYWIYHTPPFSVMVKTKWSYTATPPICSPFINLSPWSKYTEYLSPRVLYALEHIVSEVIEICHLTLASVCGQLLYLLIRYSNIYCIIWPYIFSMLCFLEMKISRLMRLHFCCGPTI
jgi:hypothetical protein